MKSYAIKFKYANSKKKGEIRVENSCFIVIEDSGIRLSENIFEDSSKDNIVEIRKNSNGLWLKNLDLTKSFIYHDILSDSYLLFKSFYKRFENISIYDHFIIDKTLFHVKGININSVFKFSSVSLKAEGLFKK